MSYTNHDHDIAIPGRTGVNVYSYTGTVIHVHVDSMEAFEDAVEQFRQADLDHKVRSKEETEDTFTFPHATARAYLDDHQVVVHGPYDEA